MQTTLIDAVHAELTRLLTTLKKDEDRTHIVVQTFFERHLFEAPRAGDKVVVTQPFTGTKSKVSAGRQGVLGDFDTEKQRWRVRLNDDSGKESTIKLKQSHFRGVNNGLPSGLLNVLHQLQNPQLQQQEEQQALLLQQQRQQQYQQEYLDAGKFWLQQEQQQAHQALQQQQQQQQAPQQIAPAWQQQQQQQYFKSSEDDAPSDEELRMRQQQQIHYNPTEQQQQQDMYPSKERQETAQWNNLELQEVLQSSDHNSEDNDKLNQALIQSRPFQLDESNQSQQQSRQNQQQDLNLNHFFQQQQQQPVSKENDSDETGRQQQNLQQPPSQTNQMARKQDVDQHNKSFDPNQIDDLDVSLNMQYHVLAKQDPHETATQQQKREFVHSMLSTCNDKYLTQHLMGLPVDQRFQALTDVLDEQEHEQHDVLEEVKVQQKQPDFPVDPSFNPQAHQHGVFGTMPPHGDRLLAGSIHKNTPLDSGMPGNHKVGRMTDKSLIIKEKDEQIEELKEKLAGMNINNQTPQQQLPNENQYDFPFESVQNSVVEFDQQTHHQPQPQPQFTQDYNNMQYNPQQQQQQQQYSDWNKYVNTAQQDNLPTQFSFGTYQQQQNRQTAGFGPSNQNDHQPVCNRYGFIM